MTGRARTGRARTGREFRRAKWRLTAVIAGAITGAILLVGVLMCLAVTADQHWQAQHDLEWAVARNSAESPPPCVWMATVRDGVTHRTPGAPAGLPVRSDLARAAAGGPPIVEERTIGPDTYLVRTERRDGAVVQAAMDLSYQQQDRHSLYLSFVAAEIVGLIAAVAAGQVLAGRAIAPLQEALRRQRRFVADASHELRTPLTRLHTRAQMLARKAQPPGPGDGPGGLGDELGALVADTRQFGEVITDLLESAQLERSDAARELVDIAAVAGSVVSAESARAQARSVRLDLRLGSGDHFVLGVPPALRRVVSALVDNALGHTRPGGHIEVVVDGARTGREVEITVIDDGVGFPPDQAELIFQRFNHRSGNGNDRRFGLGLALVREVVENHGGRVAAVGEPGQGATFTVQLPRAPVSPRTSRAARVPSARVPAALN